MILDSEQKKATKIIDKHTLIIAGAGSGKTTTLIGKINYLIKLGIKEEDILVISYTNETVNSFKEKCKFTIDVMTFHKLAKCIINSDKEIIEEEHLQKFIILFLENIPNNLKKKLYFYNFYKIYTKKRYKNNINTNTAESLTNYLFSTVKNIKANAIDFKKINSSRFSKKELLILYCSNVIINKYDKYLETNELIDFDNMIIEATDLLKNKRYINKYKYILVDEFQDISKIRLDFLIALLKSNNSILTAVGDDFQSIYGFSGSNINIFFDFKKYFNNSEILYITKTYRCPQSIISKAGKFIMKNPKQIKKELISVNKIKSKIIKVYSNNQRKDLIRIIDMYKDTNYSILIIGRNNFDINLLKNNNYKIDNSYMIINNIQYKNIRYLTIHKSKGLEADIVIIINLTNKINGIPSKQNNKLVSKLLDSSDSYKYAEERRLFYVALTRCKIKTYLLIDNNNPSIFVKEI